MIRFIQILPNTSERGDFLLQDLPGSGKRIDVLCRNLEACFDWGLTKWPREQIEFIAVIADSVILRFEDPKDAMPKGERAWAEVIKNAIQNNPPSFTHVSKGDLESVIKEFNCPPESRVWVLYEDGIPIENFSFLLSEAQNSFMLGDHRGFDFKTEELMSKFNLGKISLGNISYLSSHCVVSIISKFERMVE